MPNAPISRTGNQIIQGALIDLGCRWPAGTGAPDIKAECLLALNEMIDSLLIDRFMIYAIVANQYTLTSAYQYTIGPSGADFTADRPLRIEDANIIINTVTPTVRNLSIVIDSKRWSWIRVQQIPGSIPQYLYYDGNFSAANGNGTLNIWPGAVAGYQLELFTWQQLQSFPDLTTPIKLPPGYALCLRKNLAVNIAPMMALHFKNSTKVKGPMYDALVRDAARIKMELQSYNSPDSLVGVDPMYLSAKGGGLFNYGTGELVR
jgi:hypothetical protein